MSTSASDAPVEGPRPFTITHDDHRGVVMCVSVLFIGYAFMTIALRLAARIRNMGIDDWLAVVGTVSSVTQFAIVIGAVSHLFGASFDHYSSGDMATVAKLLRASEVFLLLSLFVVKCAVVWLCRRLFSVNQKAPIVICDILLGLSAAWCLASILIVTVGCDQQAAIGLDKGTCNGLVTRWTVVGVLDALLELLMFSVAVIVVWPLKMTVSRRLSALSCFMCRLPVLLFIGLHIYYLSDFTHDPNKGVAITKPVIFRQAELLFSLFSAAIPALNQYLRKFQTTTAATFGYSPGTYGHSYGLKSINTRSRGYASAHDKGATKDSFPATTHHGNVHNTATAGNSDDGQESLGRHNSEDLIIRKDVTVEVSYIDSERTAASSLRGPSLSKHGSQGFDKR